MIESDDYTPDDFDTALLADEAPRYQLRADLPLPQQLERALGGLMAETNLYWSDGKLVQDVEGRIVTVTRGILAVMLERRCHVVRRLQKGAFIPCRPDDSLLSALLALPAPGPLRELSAVREDAVVGADGKQLPPGYDRGSRQIVRPVTVVRGGRMLELLADLLVDYDELARASWLAALLGQLARAHYAVQPGWIIDANQPRAGKTTLANLLSVVLCGKDAVISPMPRDDAEIAKGLAGRVGQRPVVIYDNVTAQISSDALESYLSSEEWSYRLLGKDEVRSIRSNSLIAFSANGATARRDITDRCMITRLERPAGLPKWKLRNPVQRALELRAEILGAALDLLEEWAADGWPEPEWHDVGRSSGWNRWARGPAWKVYQIDPLAYRGPDDGVDVESTTLGELLEAVREIFGTAPWQTRDLLFGAGSEAREDARRCIALLGQTKMQNVDERIAGTVLSRYVGRWVETSCLRRARVGENRKRGWVLDRA